MLKIERREKKKIQHRKEKRNPSHLPSARPMETDGREGRPRENGGPLADRVFTFSSTILFFSQLILELFFVNNLDYNS